MLRLSLGDFTLILFLVTIVARINVTFIGNISIEDTIEWFIWGYGGMVVGRWIIK